MQKGVDSVGVAIGPILSDIVTGHVTISRGLISTICRIMDSILNIIFRISKPLSVNQA